MSLGYRVFFIHEGENLSRIAQKRYNSLYLKKTEPFPQYAGQTIVSVLVVYELVARKPNRIVRMDTQKIRFDEKGFIDEAYESEGLQLAAKKMDDVFGSVLNSINSCVSIQPEKSQDSIIDASKRFDDRRWVQRHPKLSGPMLKKILAGVFGPSV